MVDVEEIARRELGVLPCGPIPVRAQRPTVLEYTVAESVVRGHYGSYWMHAGGQPQTVTSQLDRLLREPGSLPLPLQIVLDALGADWRNVFTDAVMQQFSRLIRAGAPLEKLEELIAEKAGTGGPRKPDMLGISTQAGVQLDGVEVGTEKTAADTYRELRSKLNDIELIRDKVVRRLNTATDPAFPYTEERFFVRASGFRLAEHQMVHPLTVTPGPTGAVTTASWICYYPSIAWYPGGRRPDPGGPDPRGTDGLILYHIHEVTLPNTLVPAEVRKAIEDAIRTWRRENLLDLELNPAVRHALHAERDDWPPEARLLFACFGVGALVLLGGFIAVDVLLAMGAGELLVATAAAVARMPAAVTGMVRASATLASEFWRTGTAFSGLLPLAFQP